MQAELHWADLECDPPNVCSYFHFLSENLVYVGSRDFAVQH